MAKKVMITILGYRCERCSHEWAPRRDVEPRVCPKCKSPYWDRPRSARTLFDLTPSGEEEGERGRGGGGTSEGP